MGEAKDSAKQRREPKKIALLREAVIARRGVFKDSGRRAAYQEVLDMLDALRSPDDAPGGPVKSAADLCRAVRETEHGRQRQRGREAYQREQERFAQADHTEGSERT
jgi:hypothetical protein